MGTINYIGSTFDNRIYGFKRVAEVIPQKVKCKCGYTLSFIYHKKQICPVCLNYVYPTKRDEFKDKLKIKIKEKEQ